MVFSMKRQKNNESSEKSKQTVTLHKPRALGVTVFFSAPPDLVHLCLLKTTRLFRQQVTLEEEQIVSLVHKATTTGEDVQSFCSTTTAGSAHLFRVPLVPGGAAVKLLPVELSSGLHSQTVSPPIPRLVLNVLNSLLQQAAGAAASSVMCRSPAGGPIYRMQSLIFFVSEPHK